MQGAELTALQIQLDERERSGIDGRFHNTVQDLDLNLDLALFRYKAGIGSAVGKRGASGVTR